MVVLCLGLGYLSGDLSRNGDDSWFESLNKPFFQPPDSVFGPVWTVLYICMGLAAGRILTSGTSDIKKPMTFFFVQLALCFLWPILFFTLKNPLLAFIGIILLWLMIYETLVLFKRIDKWAAYLLYPYLAWVSFATILNGSIVWLNW